MVKLIKIDRKSGIPLVGAIFFGVIDRGTNWLQIRTNTSCNLKCEFCSTAANSLSIHPYNYEVELSYLLDWIKETVEYKGPGIEINIDSVGEPTAYPHLIKLVKEIKKLKNVNSISMQTNGTLLDEKKIKELEKAGLNRLNVSIETLNKELGKKLRGKFFYDVKKIAAMAKFTSENTKIKVRICPVFLPRVNEKDIEDLIKFAKEIKADLGIQKYEIYKYSRKMKEAKKQNWWKFYDKLEKWEKEYDIKLKLDKSVVQKRKSLPIFMKKGEKLQAEIKAPGWIRGQALAAAKNRAITIINCNKKIGDTVNIKIIENSNNIYLAKLV